MVSPFRWIATDPTDVRRFGGKGVGLAQLRRLGVPVPPSFTISAEARTLWVPGDERLPAELEAELRPAMAELELQSGRKFGDPERPLLVSVRGGGPSSMPGVLATVLDVGLTPSTEVGLVSWGGRRFALDCALRLLRSYGEAVLRVVPDDPALASPLAEAIGHARSGGPESLSEATLEALLEELRKIVLGRAARGVPEDPWLQLSESISAVFRSWDSARARAHRSSHNIADDHGTAVTVCAMVFGNLDAESGSGVAFSRDPNTGERRMFGEYLPQAQGDDVVSGTVTPLPLNVHSGRVSGGRTLEDVAPEVHRQLAELVDRVERAARAPQEIEFTYEQRRLFLLQTRTAKLGPRAAAASAIALVEEGAIEPPAALGLVEPSQVSAMIREAVAPGAARVVVAKGLPAAAGTASGRAVFTAFEAEARAKRGEEVILVRLETAPEDIHGIRFARAVLTARGGTTSHAAVVARALGKVAVVGAHELRIDPRAKSFTARGRTVAEGEVITIDGRTGEVLLGRPDTRSEPGSPELDRLLSWADERRKLAIFGGATDPRGAAEVIRFGADGVLALGRDSTPLTINPGEWVAAAPGRPLAFCLPPLEPEREDRLVDALVAALARTSSDRAGSGLLIIGGASLEALSSRAARLSAAIDRAAAEHQLAQLPRVAARVDRGGFLELIGELAANFALLAFDVDALNAEARAIKSDRRSVRPGESVPPSPPQPASHASVARAVARARAQREAISFGLIGAPVGDERWIELAVEQAFSFASGPPSDTAALRLAAARAHLSRGDSSGSPAPRP